MKPLNIAFAVLFAFSLIGCKKESETGGKNNPTSVSGYPIVGTKQTKSFNRLSEITTPVSGNVFYGQNSNYPGTTPSYTNNGDGTVTDNVTGLMWTQTLDLNGDGNIDVNDKLTYAEAMAGATSNTTGNYNDWRLPTIKELYSLILFNGRDVSGYSGNTDDLTPFIDKSVFGFNYGDESAGERIIDAQMASSTLYVDGQQLLFGVNFADGRIKGYGLTMPGSNDEKTFYVYYVRSNKEYGINNFVDNSDGTISDKATGLMWMQMDLDSGMIWKDALEVAENFEHAGYTDWRLPDIKELQSIVDYTRSPGTSNSAAINPLFNSTSIINENGQTDYPYYWSNTTHENMTNGSNACYICFGKGLGYINGNWVDVHGAGCQRSDPKVGNPTDYPTGHGPQGDAIRIYNFVRLVRTE